MFCDIGAVDCAGASVGGQDENFSPPVTLEK